MAKENKVIVLRPARDPGPRSADEVVAGLGLDAVKPEHRRAGSDPKGKRRSGTGPAASSDGAVILESARNTTLASIAGGMRRRGMGEAAIDAALQAMNQNQCKPPLPANEVSAIARSISSYAPADPAIVERTLTDVGNAQRFAGANVLELRFVPERMKWLVWKGQRWAWDDVAEVVERAKTVASAIYLEADNTVDDDARIAIAKFAKASQKKERLEAMIKLAQSVPGLVVPIAELDSDDWLIGIENGVIDLRTGKLRDGRPQDLITRQSRVRYDRRAKCPTFQKFLRTIFRNDRQLIAYVQRVVGYALTGKTTEHCLFFLYGHGANGKSVFLNVLLALLGSDYALQTATETLMAKRNADGSNASPDLARLKDIRLTTANEVEDGCTLAEARAKHLTGGDSVTARHLYGQQFDFTPKFKLFIAGNHKPIIRGVEEGVWRRIKLIPFEVTIPEAQRDRDLIDKLRAELSGILNWAIDGCLAWQKTGLNPPRVVLDAVKEYREEMDIMGQWIEEQCALGPVLTWKAGDAYSSYKFWCGINGFRPMSSTAFGRKLSERFTSKKQNTGKIYYGITKK